MATPRRPLQDISGNSTIKKELSLYQRGIIVGVTQAGANMGEISKAHSTAKSTIQDTLKLNSQRDNGKSRPRSGRLFSYTARDKYKVLRFVRVSLKSTYNNVQKEYGVNLLISTLKRILQKHSILNWRAKKRPALTEEVARKRYLWCKAQQHWTEDDFLKYMWSNECSAERGKSKKGEWVFCILPQKW
jgi:hypothetical protein